MAKRTRSRTALDLYPQPNTVSPIIRSYNCRAAAESQPSSAAPAAAALHPVNRDPSTVTTPHVCSNFGQFLQLQGFVPLTREA